MIVWVVLIFCYSNLKAQHFWFSGKRRPHRTGRRPLPAAHGRLPARFLDTSPFNFDIFSWPKLEDLPISLRFEESLKSGLESNDVVIYTGGDSRERRESGFCKRSALSIAKFAATHGYNLSFLDELEYDKSLNFKGLKFHPAWSRIFAFPALRKVYPDAKYYVWFDDDILVPHPETHMLNHYINLMDSDPDWHMLIADEPEPNLLNSGLLIMKNSDICYEFFEKTLLYGASTRFHKDFLWDQEGIKAIRAESDWEKYIRLIPHRHDRVYNLNTFAVNQPKYPEEIQAQFGDAFVHFCGLAPPVREKMMAEWSDKVNKWKADIKKRSKLVMHDLQLSG